jgi:hypothetical protein
MGHPMSSSRTVIESLPNQPRSTPFPSSSSVPTVTESYNRATSLATLWAQKYVISLAPHQGIYRQGDGTSLSEITSKEGREQTAKRLLRQLNTASARAWSKTESMLSGEIERHGIDLELINPWQIASDIHNIFQTVLSVYAERVTPRRLSVVIGSEIGQLRQKYTELDPRVIGFVSMQFHHTGQILLEPLATLEQSLISPYFKVVDDHLYIPLRDAYNAAAEHELDSPILAAVQQLLPITTNLAQAVCESVSRLHPGYQSYSGLLTSTMVRVSSLRDVEMFQVYLCLCALEGSLRSVQQELFPLCLMLYPQLKVSWKLVQDMLKTLAWEMHDRLAPEHFAIFLPYMESLTNIFSDEVLAMRYSI